MRKGLLLFIMLVGLGFTVIACTTGRSQRYPNYPPYPSGQGYPNYPGYPPQRSNNGFAQIQALADHLKDATAEVAEEAKELEQVSDNQQIMIERLEDLHKESKDFYEDIDQANDELNDQGYGDPRYGDPRYGDPRSGYPYGNQGYQDPRNSRVRFTELLQKYNAARKTLIESPREDEIQKDFESVTGIMRNLTRFYGYRFEPDYEYLEPTIR